MDHLAACCELVAECGRWRGRSGLVDVRSCGDLPYGVLELQILGLVLRAVLRAVVCAALRPSMVVPAQIAHRRRLSRYGEAAVEGDCVDQSAVQTQTEFLATTARE